MPLGTAYEVVIIGGGVAGCATALALARKGVPGVCVIEAGRAGANPVGESIPPDTRILLQALGVWKPFRRQEHEECIGSRSVWGSEDVGYNDFVLNPYGNGWHLDRGLFNRLLAEEALKTGAEWQASQTFLGCERTSDLGFRLRTLTRDRQTKTLVSRFVVDATGTGSVFARHTGSRPLFLDRLAFVYGFFETAGSPVPFPRATTVEAVQDGWWYLAAIPGSRIAVAFATDPELIRFHSLHLRDKWFSFLLRTNFAAAQLNRCRLAPEALIVRPAPSFLLDRAAGQGWFAVGDAASAYDPISSQGIYKALSDGIRAANTIADCLTSSRNVWEEYDTAMKMQFETYVANRNYLYSLEQRWPDSPFWKTRRQRMALEAPSAKT